VIDSGIDLDHPDLNVDTINDYDFIDGDDVADDGYGHGTHVAGIIGAKNNGAGVVGVAAGAQVVGIRVLNNSGVGADSGVIAGIDYAAGLASPGDVINLSLIADAVDPIMDAAVANAAARGILVTIAAGNSGANAANYSPGRTNGTGFTQSQRLDRATPGHAFQITEIRQSITLNLVSTSSLPIRAADIRQSPAHQWPRPTWRVYCS
jgi:subtilisin family serine protease